MEHQEQLRCGLRPGGGGELSSTRGQTIEGPCGEVGSGQDKLELLAL